MMYQIPFNSKFRFNCCKANKLGVITNYSGAFMQKSIEKINVKIRKGEATILTAEELCNMVRNGEKIRVEDVDVVTSATCGVMSGTTAAFSFRVAEEGVFIKAEKVWMNGIPAYPGPCPNERLGIIDIIVYGTSHSQDDPEKYGGGALFRDLVEGKKVKVEVETVEGKRVENEVRLKDMDFARMFTTRSAYRNYMAFVNPLPERVKTIFSVTEMKGPLKMATFSGCGELNPLEKDPELLTIGIGTKILVNGAVGYVIGHGTRSSLEKPNLSLHADMFSMKPEFMGQFITSAGPEVFISVAISIPILDEKILEYTKTLDENIPLPIANIHNRKAFEHCTYGDVWQNVDIEIQYFPEVCKKCVLSRCPVEEKCPTEAFNHEECEISQTRCFHCGACTWLCAAGAFKARLGSLKVREKVVPIVLRQSSRKKARELAIYLKNLIEKGEFQLQKPVDKIAFRKQTAGS